MRVSKLNPKHRKYLWGVLFAGFILTFIWTAIPELQNARPNHVAPSLGLTISFLSSSGWLIMWLLPAIYSRSRSWVLSFFIWPYIFWIFLLLGRAKPPKVLDDSKYQRQKEVVVSMKQRYWLLWVGTFIMAIFPAILCINLLPPSFSLFSTVFGVTYCIAYIYIWKKVETIRHESILYSLKTGLSVNEREYAAYLLALEPAITIYEETKKELSDILSTHNEDQSILKWVKIIMDNHSKLENK